MKEIFKAIPYLPNYEISNLGRLKNIKTGNITKGYVTSYGYCIVSIWKNGKQKNYFVHRFVAEQFIENHLCKPFVNHKDCNKSNNKVDNLEWVTSRENFRHAVDSGLHDRRGNKAPNRKLTLEAAKEIRGKYILGATTYKKLGQIYKVDETTIAKIIRKESWNYE